MERMQVKDIERTYANWGDHCQQALDYMLTGRRQKHDHVPFDKDSDIPEYAMSVKSNGFTLASAKINRGNTFDEKLDDFKARVHSTRFAYVDLFMVAWIMDIVEFEAFVRRWCYLDHESTKNGGGVKIKCLNESKKMRAWLEAHATAT